MTTGNSFVLPTEASNPAKSPHWFASATANFVPADATPAIVGVQLKKLAHGFPLTANVSATFAFHAVRATEGPHQPDGRFCAAQFNLQNETLRFTQRQHGQVQFAVTEQRIMDFINH